MPFYRVPVKRQGKTKYALHNDNCPCYSEHVLDYQPNCTHDSIEVMLLSHTVSTRQFERGVLQSPYIILHFYRISRVSVTATPLQRRNYVRTNRVQYIEVVLIQPSLSGAFLPAEPLDTLSHLLCETSWLFSPVLFSIW